MRKNKIRSKVQKPIKKIFFTKDEKDVVDIVNKNFPINLKNYDVVDKIYEVYSLAPKEDVALIVKTFFEVIRDNMILSYKIRFASLFNDLHFAVSTAINNKLLLKIKNKTSPKIRKNV